VADEVVLKAGGRGLTKTRRVWRQVRWNGPSSRPSVLRRRRVLPPALPFTTGHLITGRYFVLRSEDDGPGDGQETDPS